MTPDRPLQGNPPEFSSLQEALFPHAGERKKIRLKDYFVPLTLFFALCGWPFHWTGRSFRACPGSGRANRGFVFSGVSHLLHTKWPSHLRALLYKIGNVEGEVLDRLIDLNVVLPGCRRPDAVVIFLQPAQQPHP